MIGFVARYNETHDEITTYNAYDELIPDDQKATMPEWIPLPDNYEHFPGTNLINKVTGEITNIPPVSAPEIKSEQELEIEKLKSAVDSIIISILGV